MDVTLPNPEKCLVKFCRIWPFSRELWRDVKWAWRRLGLKCNGATDLGAWRSGRMVKLGKFFLEDRAALFEPTVDLRQDIAERETFQPFREAGQNAQDNAASLRAGSRLEHADVRRKSVWQQLRLRGRPMDGVVGAGAGHTGRRERPADLGSAIA